MLYGLGMTTARCTLHPAYEADYCPRCGTATVIAQSREELASRLESQTSEWESVTRLLTFDECEALRLDGTGRDGMGPWYLTNSPSTAPKRYLLHVTVPTIDIFNAYWYGTGEILAMVRTAPSGHLAMVVDYGPDQYGCQSQADRFASGSYSARVTTEEN